MLSLTLRFVLIGAILASSAGADSAATKPKKTGKSSFPAAKSAGELLEVLWTEPGDIAQRDLFYGIGGTKGAPVGKRFKFLKEDRKGSNPKFEVQDSSGTTWKVKMGVETRPETVATRLVWAVGYRTQEDYFMPEIQVTSLPARLHRGRELIEPGGVVPNVRLERDPDDVVKLGNWRWKDGPFAGTRELNGLRVLMALINNWDLKDVNNGVFTPKNRNPRDIPQRIYMVTDLGASFGTNGIGRGHEKSRGNLTSYQNSRFITKTQSDEVDFATPGKPTPWALVSPPHYIYRMKLRWLGRDIPREDAKWMGRLLSRLSKKQLRDAFRAAGYEPPAAEAFTQVVETRVAALNAL